MLALKSALQRADPVPTLVFDEIEMGVGGRGGDVVGRKLWSLAGGRQVLCITHLPQVACYGDTHLRVAKEVVLDRSFTQVEPLQGEARLGEMAAMLGGASERLRESARELLGRARAWKGRREGP
jgi:DNA repair protein RecN (Recombination protein N)